MSTPRNYEEKLFGRGIAFAHEANDFRDGVSVLSQKHGIPPFSYLNTQSKDWKDRRRRWLALGIQSELGRKDGLTYAIPEKLADGRVARHIKEQTSVFDPVVTEMSYLWWAPPGCIIIDPFAGGSVRGIVASVMGYKYWGCDLSAEQIGANKAQLTEKTTGEFKPKWVVGNSLATMPTAPMADFLFTCPPYGNLEVYSQDPADISNKNYQEFLYLYSQIINKSYARLNPDSFAAIVVGNYRNPKSGVMHDLVGDTIHAAGLVGLEFYNDAVIVNNVGSAGMRCNTNFLRGNRKLVKLHQNLLVFVKGDPAKAVAKWKLS